jgi:hypothetical protein
MPFWIGSRRSARGRGNRGKIGWPGYSENDPDRRMEGECDDHQPPAGSAVHA